jgi:hypothetical protein
MRRVFLTTTILSALALVSLPASAFEAGVDAGGGASAGVGASAGGVGAGAEGGVSAGASAAADAATSSGAEVGSNTAADAGMNADAAAATSTGGTAANTTGRGILGGLFGFLNGRSAETRSAVQSQAAATSEAIGAAMVSADGARVGTVTDVTADASGQTFLVVALDDQLGVGVDSVRIRAEKTAFADQQVQLTGVTQAGFVSSLQSQLGGEAGAGLR